MADDPSDRGRSAARPVTTYEPVPIERPTSVVKIQPWGEEITLAETPAYTLKKLLYRKGLAGGLQFHVKKDESFYIESGTAVVTSDNGAGTLIKHHVADGDCFHIPAGAVHKFEAVTECVVFEASTNVSDDRVRMERFFYGEEPEGLPSTHPEPTR